jgi:hypothetical protein
MDSIVVVVLIVDVALATTILAMRGFASIDAKALLAAHLVHIEVLHTRGSYELKPSSMDVANQTVTHDRSSAWTAVPRLRQCLFVEGRARIDWILPFRFPDFRVSISRAISVAEHPSGVDPVVEVAEEIHKELSLHTLRGFAHGCLVVACLYIPYCLSL